MYVCNKCNYSTLNKAHYEKHLLTDKHKTFSCNICNKIYKSRGGLWKHKNEKHKNNEIILNNNQNFEKFKEISRFLITS